jgi:hypothetical protein
MNLEVNEILLEQLKTGKGQTYISIADLKKLTHLLGVKTARVITYHGEFYLRFAELPNIEFGVTDANDEKDFSFVPEADLEFINAGGRDHNFGGFILRELLQGKGWARISRLGVTLLPLFLFNILAYNYATFESAKDVFSGMLAAVSVFVAVFSIFTISYDHLRRKMLDLFENGKLSYFFCIDKHMTRTGVYAIFISITGLIVSATSSDKSVPLYHVYTHNILTLALLNTALLLIWIILRSLHEFYIGRPGVFILSDMKKKSFEKFRDGDI